MQGVQNTTLQVFALVSSDPGGTGPAYSTAQLREQERKREAAPLPVKLEIPTQ